VNFIAERLCERRAPDDIILKVLRHFPEAAMKVGEHSNYPLHIAARQCLSHIVLISLVKHFPEALDEVNDDRFTPRKYHQRSERSRSVLMRPTACWIETVEREEYESKRMEEIEDLKVRIGKLRENLAKSKVEENKVVAKVAEIEPILISQANIFASSAINERGALLQKKSMCDIFKSMHGRTIVLERSIDSNLDQAEISKVMTSKREFFDSAKGEYEKVVSICNEVRDEIDLLKQVLTGCT